ncbi:hypothetical protein ABT034_15300 [Streptomyces sp. NPDC002773]|uniref:hypothetical protein n=1 Tax=Streptomyces sp. NPDC002773 TaxID=3154430 RepID=UPI003333ED61
MTAFAPLIMCTHVVPGTSHGEDVRLTRLPAGDMTVRVEGVGPLVRVGSVEVSQIFRRRMRRDEIDELPPFPPEIRESARRHAVVEDSVVLVEGTGTEPVPVGGHGHEVRVRLECAAPETAAAQWHTGRMLVLMDGEPAGELPLYVSVGAGDHVPLVEPDLIRLGMEPGETKSANVFVGKAPSGADLRVFLVGGAPTVRSSETVVSREKILTFQQAQRLGLLDGMSPQELDRVRDEGYRDFQEVGRATGTGPVQVRRGDQVLVRVNFVAAENWGGVANSVLKLMAPQWTPVNVPVEAIVEDVAVTLERDTLAVGQGGTAELAVTVTSGLGAGGEVTFGIQGWDSGLSVPEIHLVYEPFAERTVSLPLRVARTAPVGPVLHARLAASFHGGVTMRYADLRVEVLPGATTVWTSPLTLDVLTGGSAQLTVSVSSDGGSKTVRLTPAALPPGVTVESGTLELSPGDAPKTCPLRLDVHPEHARPAAGLPIGIDWSSNGGVQRGTAVSELTIRQRPESRTFSLPVITPDGVPLGGRVEYVLNSDGSARFKGFMEATGLLSYEFCVRGVVRSANGLVAVIAQASGSVFGWDTPGPDRRDWDQDASEVEIAARWPDLRTGTLSVSRSSELTGLIGGVADLAGDVLEFAVTSALLSPLGPAGHCLAGLVFVGSELGALSNTSLFEAGGLPGLALAGGAAFLLGPTMIIPVFVGGVLIGNALVRHRRLRPTEKASALECFEDTLPWDRIRLTNLSGQENQAFVTPSTDGTILVNLGDAYDNPSEGLLMHELTHAWQVAHKSFKSEYFWKAALDKLGGSASYLYGPPGPPFRSFGIEAQASIVEQWWTGETHKSVGGIPPAMLPPTGHRPPRSTYDPYFRYISDNIRMGES